MPESGHSCALQLPAYGVWALRRPRLRHASGSCLLRAATRLRLLYIRAFLGCLLPALSPFLAFAVAGCSADNVLLLNARGSRCAIGGRHDSSGGSSLLDKQRYYAQLQWRAGICCACYTLERGELSCWLWQSRPRVPRLPWYQSVCWWQGGGGAARAGHADRHCRRRADPDRQRHAAGRTAAAVRVPAAACAGARTVGCVALLRCPAKRARRFQHPALSSRKAPEPSAQRSCNLKPPPEPASPCYELPTPGGYDPAAGKLARSCARLAKSHARALRPASCAGRRR